MGKQRGKCKPKHASSVTAAVTTMPSISPEDLDIVKVTFNKAEKLLRDGHFQDALTLIDSETQRYQSYPAAHTAHSLIYRLSAQLAADDSVKQNCFKIAEASISRAFSLSPCSIYNVFLHASILYEWRSCRPGDFYGDVITKCDSALLIAQPIDPCDEPFMNHEKMLQLTIPENRTKYCYQLIGFLRENAINCTNVRRESTSLDDILLNPRQLKNRNQMAALRQLMAGLDRKHDVQEYLQTLSFADLRALNLDMVCISELQRGQLGKLETEALFIAKAGDTSFIRWPCCYCKEQFSVEDYHMKHVMQAHVGCFSPETEAAIPKKGKTSEHWIRRSKAEGWRPLEDPQEENSLSADACAERTELLERIRHVFEMLVNEGILTDFHVCNLIENTVEEVLTLRSSAKMIQDKVFESNACIRLMPSKKLKLVLTFLEEIHHLGENNNTEDYSEDLQLQEPKKIPLILDSEKKTFILDIPNCGDPQTLVEFLYVGWSDDPHKIIWNRMLVKSRQILEKIQVELSFLCRLCDEKQQHYDAFHNLEVLGLEDLKRGREELDGKVGSNSVELVTISKILEEAASDAGDGSQIITSKIAELKFQICMIEARIMWTQRTILQLEGRIGPTSLYDYQIVLSQLVKSFLQKRLEGLAEKVAHDKAYAIARELEEEEDTKKPGDPKKINRGGSHPKQEKGKPKQKSKNKSTKNVEEKKVIDRSKQPIREETTEKDELQDENTMTDSNDFPGEQLNNISWGDDSLGVGHPNELGEDNYLLDMVFKLLNHLRRFQDAFQSSDHEHVAGFCLICEFHNIFATMNEVSNGTQAKAVVPTRLRDALMETTYAINRFSLQEPDASDVLAAIFNCLHQAFSPFVDCDAKVSATNCTTCIAHDLFGMNINESLISDCGLLSRESLYRQYFYYIDATALREQKVNCTVRSFDELIKEMRSFLYDEDDGGCGALHQGCLHVVRPPHFFTIVLGWDSMSISADVLSETLGAITMEVDLGVIYCGLNRGCKRRLVSMICVYEERYIFCTYNTEHANWVMYDRLTVEDIGDWADVRYMFVLMRCLPQVLVFESDN